MKIGSEILIKHNANLKTETISQNLLNVFCADHDETIAECENSSNNVF